MTAVIRAPPPPWNEAAVPLRAPSEPRVRVVALGGAGRMGRHAARVASELGLAERLVIADRDGRAAAAVARACGPRAVGIALDAEDPAGLACALEGADVVLNTAGPFHRLGVAPLAAALAAGCHYLDIGDDWEATREMLALDADVRAARLSAVIGIGASPGITNLLAACAARLLDRVDAVLTGWSLEAATVEDDGASAGTSAAVAHFLHQIRGGILVWRAGRLVEAAPLEPTAIDLPGFPPALGLTIGHPEPLTFGRAWPDLRESANVMVGSAAALDAVCELAGAARRGTPAFDEAAALPPLFALVHGERDGRPARVGAHLTALPPGGMSGAAGTPLAVALGLLTRGMIAYEGVAAPEAAIEPDAFFDALAPLCAPARDGHEDLVAVRCDQERRAG